MRKILPLLLLCAAACTREPDPVHDPRANENAPDPGAMRRPPPPDDAPAGGLSYQVPAEWKAQKASGFRKAQYAVPDKDKAEGDALFLYFGAMGGGIDANITRWKGMFDKQPSEPAQEEIKAGDLTVHLLDISGDYTPADMGAEAQTDQRGLFAIVETSTGHHFFRLIGPRGTVGDWRDAYVEMLKTSKAR